MAMDIAISSTAAAHLQDVSPGSLSDTQLNLWGYEKPYVPEGQTTEEFTRECREAVNHPIKSVRRGRGWSVTLRFPTAAHAKACAYCLREVGEDFVSSGGGFDPETRNEGRALVKAAAQIEEATS